MADQNKQYILSLNEEQIKIVMWETKKYHEQLLMGGQPDDMPLPIWVLAEGYDSVYNACRELLSDKMIIEDVQDTDEPKEQPDVDSDVKNEESDTKTEEDNENNVGNVGNDEETDTNTENTEESGTETPKDDSDDGWVRPEEYKDSPLTDEEIKELLGWLGQ